MVAREQDLHLELGHSIHPHRARRRRQLCGELSIQPSTASHLAKVFGSLLIVMAVYILWRELLMGS
ncbi:MAG: hypothetical protein ACI9F9_001676 [Candidatus Paceibacteria bacterium]|jgi:hypothetical protein